MLPDHQADGIAKVMKIPTISKTRGHQLDWLATDSLAWIHCRPKSHSESQSQSCSGSNYMHKGEPFIVFEEFTLLKTQKRTEVPHCQIYLKKDTIKHVSFLQRQRQRFYSFPLTMFPATPLPSCSGPIEFAITGTVNKAGIKFWSYTFTLEPGECYSPRTVLSITDMKKFLSSHLWVNGYMRIGQAKGLFGTSQTQSELNLLIFKHREMMKGQKIQAYKLKEIPLFRSEPELQKEGRITCKSIRNYDPTRSPQIEYPQKTGRKAVGELEKEFRQEEDVEMEIPQEISETKNTGNEKLNKHLVKIDLTGQCKVGVLVWDSMFFDFTQPFLVGLKNMTNKELDVKAVSPFSTMILFHV